MEKKPYKTDAMKNKMIEFMQFLLGCYYQAEKFRHTDNMNMFMNQLNACMAMFYSATGKAVTIENEKIVLKED